MSGGEAAEGRLRARAAQLVKEVMAGEASLAERMEALREGLEPRDAALVQALVYGSLRAAPRLQWYLDQLLDRPLRSRDRIVAAVIMLGFHQLEATRIPAHAAVSETVAAVRRLRRPRAAGLVNAVLRRFQREQADLRQRCQDHEPAHWMHPQWWIDAFRRDWPDDWHGILEAGNQQPPMSLRVHRGRDSRDAYLARLAAADIAARAGQAPSSVILETPRPVEELPGFAAGDCSVQDEAAQWAVELLDPQDGERILDACAAPGGKTAQILEAAPAAELVALDSDAGRNERVTENLHRIGASARVVTADLLRLQDWWDGHAFDRILLDAPCSASGVIRRHPDIKLLRTADDIAERAALQQRMLAAAWDLLAPGGRLMYVTCSVFRAENEDVVMRFLASCDDARECAVTVPAAQSCKTGVQRLPGAADGDGFYYACLERVAG